MAARILAFIVAVAMVAGAIWYRGQRDDDNDPEAGDTDVAADAPLRLVCATELQTACEAIVDDADERIDRIVESAGTTADRLTAVRGAAGLEVWLTPGPWPAMVRDARVRAAIDPLLQTPARAVARARVGIAMWKERADALTRRCPVDLKCLGEAAADGSWVKSGGQPTWGEIDLGLASPLTEASGLAVLAAGTVAFFGRTDVSTIDLEGDDYRRWLSGLARAARDADLLRMLATGVAETDAVATFEPLITPVVRTAARGKDVVVIYPSNVASTDVVLGTVPGKRANRLVEILTSEESRRAFERAGWRATAAPTRSLPDAGLYAALRSAWGDVRR